MIDRYMCHLNVTPSVLIALQYGASWAAETLVYGASAGYCGRPAPDRLGLDRHTPHTRTQKKEPARCAGSFSVFRKVYQTLLPQTLFPNSAISVTIHPRFERTMYFIMVLPPVVCFRHLCSIGYPSICFRPLLSVPRSGKSGAIVPARGEKLLILSITGG
jgi:hypothetical protein